MEHCGTRGVPQVLLESQVLAETVHSSGSNWGQICCNWMLNCNFLTNPESCRVCNKAMVPIRPYDGPTHEKKFGHLINVIIFYPVLNVKRRNTQKCSMCELTLTQSPLGNCFSLSVFNILSSCDEYLERRKTVGH